MIRNFILLLVTFLFCLLILEIGIRKTGKYQLYSERVFNDFVLDYGRQVKNDHIYNYTPNSEGSHTTVEFDFACSYNNYGFRDEDWPDEIDTTKTHVYFAGDSFIEGVGSSCGSDLPSQFGEQMDTDSIMVYNTGRSGGDVFFAYKVIEHLILDRDPDLILFGVNDTDAFEFLTRGGFERFQSNGMTVYRQAPIPVNLYRFSYLYRFYLHEVRHLSRYSFLNEEDQLYQENLAVTEIISAIVKADSLCQSNGVKLMPFFYPAPRIIDGEEMASNEDDLLQILDGVLSNGIEAVDLRESFQSEKDRIGEEFSELYWAMDGHFNDRGYYLFASLLLQQLQLEHELFRTSPLK